MKIDLRKLNMNVKVVALFLTGVSIHKKSNSLFCKNNIPNFQDLLLSLEYSNFWGRVEQLDTKQNKVHNTLAFQKFWKRLIVILKMSIR